MVLSPDVLLYVHNNPASQVATVVEPIAAGLRRNWDGEVLVAHQSQVQVWLGERPGVVVAGRSVIPATAYVRTFYSPYGEVLGRALHALGCRVVNTPNAGALARSKFTTAAHLAVAGVPVPPQLLVPAAAGSHLTQLDRLGWPLVLKRDNGMNGTQVHLAETAADVAVETTAGHYNAAWLAQEYLPEANGDVRLLVAGGRFVAAMRRTPAEGNFRANIAQGGRAEALEPTPLEVDIAERSARALGLTVGGVDLLRTESGPTVTEVNANPGLSSLAALWGEGIYDAVATAVAGA